MSLSLLIENFSGKNRVCQPLQMIARKVVETHNLPADPDTVLFLQDEQTEKHARTASDIARVPEMWRDVLFQLTLKRFDFVVKFISANIEGTPRKLFEALMYHELRHIKKDAETNELYLDKHHDIEDWSELARYGDWENDAKARLSLPSLMTEPVERKEATECGGTVRTCANMDI